MSVGAAGGVIVDKRKELAADQTETTGVEWDGSLSRLWTRQYQVFDVGRVGVQLVPESQPEV